MEQKNSKSLIVVWSLVFIIMLAHVFNPRTSGDAYKKELSYDTFCYYLYLPMTFIYDDIEMQKQDTIKAIFEKYKPSPTLYQIYKIENGNWTPNYTCGLSIVWFPFFMIGDTWATLSDDYPADGFSFPYQFSIAMGTILIVLTGVFALRKVLLNFFSDTVSAITLVFTILATMVFHEDFDDYLQPNALLFTGYAWLLHCTILWHKTPKKKYAIYMGLLMGIMTLIRPSDILCMLLPLLWNVYDKASFKAKLELLKNHFSHLVYIAAAVFVAALPQIIYWKIVTDSFIFFSYQRTEGFDFAHPHFYESLFSFKKSLLIYTPITIFPVIGIFLLRKQHKEIYFSVVSFVVLNFLLLASWACWWQGGGYGSRYFTQSFVVMALPFGALINALLHAKWWWKIIGGVPLFAFLLLNLFQTWQCVNFIIPPDRMNFEYYKRIWLKIDVNEEDRSFMEVERSYGPVELFTNEQNYDRRSVAFYNFENLNTDIVDAGRLDTFALSKPYAYRYTADQEWGMEYSIPYEDLLKKGDDHVWLRVSVDYFAGASISENPGSIVINMPHGDYLLKYKAFDLEKYPFKPNEWNHISFDWMTPFPYLESDKIQCYIWHKGKQNFFIDNLHIEAFHKKR